MISETTFTPKVSLFVGLVAGFTIGILGAMFLPETPEEQIARLNAEQMEWKMKFDREKQMLDAIGPYLQYMNR